MPFSIMVAEFLQVRRPVSRGHRLAEHRLQPTPAPEFRDRLSFDLHVFSNTLSHQASTTVSKPGVSVHVGGDFRDQLLLTQASTHSN